MAGMPEANLQAENLRLAEQVRVLSGDVHVRREATPWRDATPEERLAETWRLCALVPWFQSLWPEDVRARADAPESLPASTMAILERLKKSGKKECRRSRHRRPTFWLGSPTGLTKTACPTPSAVLWRSARGGYPGQPLTWTYRSSSAKMSSMACSTVWSEQVPWWSERKPAGRWHAQDFSSRTSAERASMFLSPIIRGTRRCSAGAFRCRHPTGIRAGSFRRKTRPWPSCSTRDPRTCRISSDCLPCKPDASILRICASGCRSWSQPGTHVFNYSMISRAVARNYCTD